MCALCYLIRLIIPSTLLIHVRGTLALQIQEIANIVQLIANFPIYRTHKHVALLLIVRRVFSKQYDSEKNYYKIKKIKNIFLG